MSFPTATLALLAFFPSSALASARQSFGDLNVLAGTTISDPVGAVPTDVDLDGDLDVIVGSRTGHGLSYIENLGGGAFAPPRAIGPSVDDCSGVQAGDIDGDGDDDLVVSAFGDNSVVWLENLGQARFGSAQRIGAGQLNDPRDAHLGDVDGDGIVDVVIASRGNILHWARNRGGGNFESALRLIFDSFGSNPGVLHVADVDGDGDLDVGHLNGQQPHVSLFRNNGGGQSWTSTFRGLGLPSQYYGADIEGGDLDGDGQMDLAVVTRGVSADDVVIFSDVAAGLGNPMFLDGTNVNASGVAFADMDGDGLTDLLLSGSELAYRPHQGGFVFGPPVIITDLDIGRTAAAADLNGDGQVDPLATSTYQSGKVVIALSSGVGTYGPGVEISASDILDPRDLITFDPDGDGDLDVFGAIRGSEQVVWFENHGAGAIGGAQVLSGSIAGPSILRAIDVDVDGDTDLLVAAAPHVWWLECLGGTSFAPAAIVAITPTECTGVDAGDLDGDGIPDLVYSVDASRLLAYSLGLGGGAFASATAIPGLNPLHGPKGLEIADLDGDGDNDIVVASSTSTEGTVDWLENVNGLADFAPHPILGQPPFELEGAHDVLARDVNGDGHPDVFGIGTRGCSYARSSAGGQFGSPASLVGFSPPPLAMDLADVDGDGFLDFVHSVRVQFAADAIRLRRGLGPGNFGPVQTMTEEPEFVVHVHCADLDGDGDADTLSASSETSSIGWTRTEGTPSGGIGTSYCGPAVSNSTGFPGRLALIGSAVADANQLELVATDLPRFSFGFFVGSRTQGFVVGPGGSQGNLCLGGAIARFLDSIESSGGSGEIDFSIDLQSIPLTPVVPAQAGETWSFQLWYRDVNPQNTSNYTDGVQLLLR